MKHDVVANAQFFGPMMQTQAVVLTTFGLAMRMGGADDVIQHVRMCADNIRQGINHEFDTLAR